MKKTHLISLLLSLVVAANVHAEADADIMKADANNDGKVSFDEFKAAHEQEMITRFKNKDINQDGFVDSEEKLVAKEKKKAKQKVENAAKKQATREQYQEERKRRKKHFFKYH